MANYIAHNWGDGGKRCLSKPLLNLLAEEQSPSNNTPTADQVERSEYRVQRIRELMSGLVPTDEAQS